MTNHPFTKSTFETIWLKHFKESCKPKLFKSISPLKFYKDKKLPLFVNVGKNITNGEYYIIDESESDYKGKTFLVYDVPEYFNLKSSFQNNIKIKKARQYKGFACDLKGYETFEDYFKQVYPKSKSRTKYRRNINRLEACFDVEYKTYHGNIEIEEYDLVFDKMISFIKKRFDSLGLDNNIVSKRDYYYELAYDMIKSKNAVLFAIFADGEPIGISFSFLSDKILFFAITTFDIDFIRYNLGHTTIIKQLEWCLDNGIEVFDFSKGEYEYKVRWSNLTYNYETHVLYDSNSIKSIIIASLTCYFFRFKQFLRDKKINRLYSRLKYLLKSKSNVTNDNYFAVREIENNDIDYDSLVKVDFNDDKFELLKEPVLTYLYINPERFKNLKYYKSEVDESYFVIGKSTRLHLTKNS